MRRRYYQALHWGACTLFHLYVLWLRQARRFTRRQRRTRRYALHTGLIGED